MANELTMRQGDDGAAEPAVTKSSRPADTETLYSAGRR